MSESTMASVAIIVVKSIFLCLFILLAVVGNISVIYVVLRVKKLRTIPNYFVVNLAVADLLFAVTGMPMILVTAITHKWILGSVLCDTGGFLNSLFCLVSIWTLAMISVNRYFAVAKATTVKDIYTKKRTKLLIAAVWLWSAAIACPPLFGWSRFKPGTNFCTIDGQNDLSYSIMLVILAYFVPLLILAGLYCKIFFMLENHQNTLKQGKIPSFPSYGAADGDSSTNYSDTDSMDSTHGYNIMKKPTRKGLQMLAKFTAKKSRRSSARDRTTSGFVEIRINGPDSSPVHSNSPAVSLRSDSNDIVPLDICGNEPDPNLLPSNGSLSKPLATLSVSPSVSLRGSNESVDSKEKTLSGALKKDAPLALHKKKKRTARRIFKEVRITKMLFTVVAVFFFCWTPFVVASILYGLNVTVSNFELMTVAIMFACLNSVCNPVIYAMMNKNFRDAFVHLFKRLVGFKCTSESRPKT